MNPIAMAALLLGLLAIFAWSANRRLRLVRVGNPTHESRVSPVGARLRSVWTFAIYQKKLRNYLAAGIAHQLIFLGFIVLLARSIILWGRGFVPEFNLFVLGPEPVLGLPLGEVYAFIKDVFALLVLGGVAVFTYYRTFAPQKRMTLGWEGLLILGIIAIMMVADLTYDGAAAVLNVQSASACVSGASPAWCASAATIIAPLPAAPDSIAWHPYPEPGSSALAVLLQGWSPTALILIAHAGYWTHASLVLIFLNLLPYTKHFHIITAIPNVFLGDLTAPGRLRPVARSTETLLGMVDQAMQKEDMLTAPIGYARIEHFTWKDLLDFYSCTECGRCTDHCPAALTGKVLSPKQLTLDLRNHLYGRQTEFLEVGQVARVTLEQLEASVVGTTPDGTADAEAGTEARASTVAADAATDATAPKNTATYAPIDLVPQVVSQDVLWGCLTCRACEEQCPVNITYVDKIVAMRRNLVMIRGELFPSELGKPFEGMEVNGNPWNLSRMDRAAWAAGLDVPTFAEKPDAEVLFWVGCAPSFDDRAKKIARAMVRLLRLAKVDFAILGEEESCTGDAARRAGNEFLFASLAEQNVATLNGYVEQGGVKQIVTTCPHCFNTLANEYPDFGGSYRVMHHADYLLGLLEAGCLVPTHPVRRTVVYHDSCYLGRYNGRYRSPRELLRRIPGLELREPAHFREHRALCCGAGGAQMWMEEQNKDRVNVKRTRQLLETDATTLATACPFCMTMLTDGLKNDNQDEAVQNLDLAELLAAACGATECAGDARAAGSATA